MRRAELERTAAQVKAAEERKRRRVTLALATAVVALMAVDGLGGMYWQRQQAEQARQAAELRQGVETALTKAGGLQHQARWAEARAVLEQTRDRLGEAGPDDLLQRVKQAMADLALVDRLEAIRLRRAIWVEGHFDNEGAERDYAATFRDAGLGAEGEDTETVAARVRASAVGEHLVATLDDWAAVTYDPKRQEWLLEVARRADPDPWRDRFRDPKVWADQVRLVALAKELLDDEKQLTRQKPQLLTALGTVLRWTKADPVPLLSAAQALHPDDFWLNFDLGNALNGAKKWDEAVGFYRGAVAIRPSAGPVHNNLGIVLYAKKRPDEAIQEFRRAIELDSNLAPAYNNLGNALYDKRLPDEAIQEYRRAIELDPKNASSHGALGATLLQLGRFAEAREYTRNSLDLLQNDDPLRQLATRQLQQCEQFLAVDEKLAAILEGKAKPANDAERLALARLCQQPYKQLNAAATRFYAEAFANDAKLADDMQTQVRYNAARAAVLAGCGQGNDADKLDDKERGRLRQQAVAWLRADLGYWTKQAESDKPKEREVVQRTLKHWQEDTDLAGIRDKDAVDKLPVEERQACQKLWADVAKLLEKADAKT